MGLAGGKPSWTAKLLSSPKLLCKKVREEAGELCQTLEDNEGPERAASEAADLLYHSLVLLNLQVALVPKQILSELDSCWVECTPAAKIVWDMPFCCSGHLSCPGVRRMWMLQLC